MKLLLHLPLFFCCLCFFASCSKSKDKIEIPQKNLYENEVYGTNKSFLGAPESLMMDVYLPDGAVNTTKKYPLVLYVHGGGFVKGDKSTAAGLAKALNTQGFAVASINYRLGWTQDSVNICNGDSLEAKEAIYRALQDTRAAFRFITAHADKYGVDTSWMFMSGSSAGGVTTLYMPVVNEGNVNQLFPEFEKRLGQLNSGNELRNSFTIKGLIDMWGVIHDVNLITKQNALPTLIFHGMLDRVCPYDISHFYSCESFPVSYGAKPVFEKLNALNVPVVANIDPTGGHGVYDVKFRATNTACFLNSLMAGTLKTMFNTEGTGNCP